jgi:hypothetical protein
MSSHTGPNRPEGHAIIGIFWGLVLTFILLGLIVLPALLIANGLGLVVLLIALVLWLVVIRCRAWRP